MAAGGGDVSPGNRYPDTDTYPVENMGLFVILQVLFRAWCLVFRAQSDYQVEKLMEIVRRRDPHQSLMKEIAPH